MKKYILVIPSLSDDKYFLNKAYTEVLLINGFVPILATYDLSFENYRSIVSGILLTGGGDLSPLLLNEPLHPKASTIVKQRDIFEKEIILKAIQEKIPLLAICRGAQVLNCALGGNINQHIEKHIQAEPRQIPTHNITIKKDTLLYKILGKASIKVNSFHHQCVDKIADNLKISATAEDNIVEAIEYYNQNYFCLGLQWHPEALNDNNSKKIFNYFCNECQNML